MYNRNGSIIFHPKYMHNILETTWLSIADKQMQRLHAILHDNGCNCTYKRRAKNNLKRMGGGKRGCIYGQSCSVQGCKVNQWVEYKLHGLDTWQR